MKFKNHKHLITNLLAASLMCLFACEDFVKIDPPRTELVKKTVFTDDATAQAAIIDIYYQLRLPSGFASGSQNSISFLGAISSDESLNQYIRASAATILEYQQFSNNNLEASNSYVLRLWTDLYTCIYKSNAIIEQLELAEGITEKIKNQLKGEAKFIRAFCHFYLVNLWGDVPLVTSTDYRKNAVIPRTPITGVYSQIIADLLDAQNLLSNEYSFSNGERVRANKAAATALLARTYLYMSDWSNAEMQASSIINNSAQYQLSPDLQQVFKANSNEAIFQLWNNYIATDRLTFFVYPTGADYCSLRPELKKSFENSDLRGSLWVGAEIIGSDTLFYPTKYLSIALPPRDYSTVLRLAELYLIRAEARAQQDKIDEAQDDINIIRLRAGLGETLANDKSSLLEAVAIERRHELFNEWGHRWLDLKRTAKVDEVLSPMKPEWVSTAALFPIPEYQLLNDPAMRESQNPGY